MLRLILSNNLTLIKDISGNDELLLSSYDNLQKIKSNKDKLKNGIELLQNSNQFVEAFQSRFDGCKGKKRKRTKNLTELNHSILFYVAQVLNHLIENDQFKKGVSKSLRVCLGGKASTLYKIVFEDSEEQERLSKLIEKVTQEFLALFQLSLPIRQNMKFLTDY